MDIKNSNVLLVGSGYMSREYLRVLEALRCMVTVVGRGIEKTETLKKEFPQFAYHSGGLQDYLSGEINLPEYAISAVNVEFLATTALQLLNKGIKNVLVEKPGGLDQEEIDNLFNTALQKNANLFIAYNRRFYASVEYLKEKVKEDGGITSISFEFTEWVHTIDPLTYSEETLEKFVIANSSHVIDTVFNLAGRPAVLNSLVSGNAVPWHSAGSAFVGSGVTENGVLFSYASNWDAPGRWAVEVYTPKRRYYLKPMERLAEQEKGSVKIEPFEADYSIDEQFKPGVMKMVKAFLNLNDSILCTIKEHQANFSYYEKIAGYKK